jgi:S1-C subfamily serine protease
MRALSAVAIIAVIVSVFVLASMAGPGKLILSQVSIPGSCVQIQSSNSAGTGFVVRQASGLWIIATAKHVVTEGDGSISQAIKVDGVPARVLRLDPNNDIALVTVPDWGDDKYRVFELAPMPQVGDETMLYGFHFHQTDDANAGALPFASEGLMHLYGHVALLAWIDDDKAYICTNSGGYPGTSGGALTNRQGQVIGVMSRFTQMHGMLNDALVLSVPVDALRKLIAGGGVEPSTQPTVSVRHQERPRLHRGPWRWECRPLYPVMPYPYQPYIYNVPNYEPNYAVG